MPGQQLRRDRLKEKAVAALLSNRTNEEVARELGIKSRTLRRWLKRPEFCELLHEARREAFAPVKARIQQAAPVAANVLLKTLLDPQTKDAVRVNTARFVLEFAQETLDFEPFALRLDRYEQDIASDRTPRPEPTENLNDTPEPA